MGREGEVEVLELFCGEEAGVRWSMQQLLSRVGRSRSRGGLHGSLHGRQSKPRRRLRFAVGNDESSEVVLCLALEVSA